MYNSYNHEPTPSHQLLPFPGELGRGQMGFGGCERLQYPPHRHSQSGCKTMCFYISTEQSMLLHEIYTTQDMYARESKTTAVYTVLLATQIFGDCLKYAIGVI